MSNNISILDEKKLFKKLKSLVQDNKSSASLIRLKKGEELFSVGSTPQGIYYLHLGRIKLVQDHHNTEKALVRIASPGDVIGLYSLIKNEQYPNSAEAMELSEVWFISKDEFLDLLKEDIQFTNTLLVKVCKDLDFSEKHIADLKTKDVRQRLATALLLLSHAHQNDNGEIIYIKRKDLAAFVGTTAETMSRLMNQFVSEKLIHFPGSKEIAISNPRKLMEIANLTD